MSVIKLVIEVHTDGPIPLPLSVVIGPRVTADDFLPTPRDPPEPSPVPGSAPPPESAPVLIGGGDRWTPTAEQKDAFYPSAVDGGQHDTWKREIALAVWRFLTDPERAIARAAFDLGDHVAAPLSAVFPIAPDCSARLRYLGFARMVRSALGYESSTPDCTVAPSQWPVGGPFGTLTSVGPLSVDDLIHQLHTQHCLAAQAQVQVAMASNERRRASWDEQLRGPFSCDSEEDLAQLFDVGALIRPDLDECPPLRGLRILRQLDPWGGAPPARTPSPQPPSSEPGGDHQAQETP